MSTSVRVGSDACHSQPVAAILPSVCTTTSSIKASVLVRKRLYPVELNDVSRSPFDERRPTVVVAEVPSDVWPPKTILPSFCSAIDLILPPGISVSLEMPSELNELSTVPVGVMATTVAEPFI